MLNPFKSEAERIRFEAEQKRKFAIESGLHNLVSEIYHGYVINYPTWLKNPGDHIVPPIVTKASEIKLRDKKARGTKIKLNGKDFSFVYKDVEYAYYREGKEYGLYGVLEVSLGNQKVIEVSEMAEYGQLSVQYYPIGVNAFIEGVWMDDLRQLKEAIDATESERQKVLELKRLENPQEISRLKRDFGIK
jgi:hypothetical protein